MTAMKITCAGKKGTYDIPQKKSRIPFYNSIQDFLLSLNHPKRKFGDINI